jgi:hypothetical protein
VHYSGHFFIRYVPEEFMKLEYQEQAVLNAKRILEEYGGVFIVCLLNLASPCSTQAGGTIIETPSLLGA